MTDPTQYMSFVKSGLLAIYVYYMLNKFETTYSIHHPLEILIQEMTLSDFLKHPIYKSVYESKVCPFGKLCGTLMALFLVIRYILPAPYIYNISLILWILFIVGSLVLNLNVFVYLIPAAIIDICFILPHTCKT